jgi:hypothetical protein
MVTATSNCDPHPRCTLTPDEGQFGGDRCPRLSGSGRTHPLIGNEVALSTVRPPDRRTLTGLM